MCSITLGTRGFGTRDREKRGTEGKIMPIIASYLDDKGIEWQLWRSTRANDPLGPLYVVKKYPSGQTKLSAWGLRDTRSSASGTEAKPQ